MYIDIKTYPNNVTFEKVLDSYISENVKRGHITNYWRTLEVIFCKLLFSPSLHMLCIKQIYKNLRTKSERKIKQITTHLSGK